MSADRLTQASEWFVRLRERDLTTEEIAAWLRWCKEHPDNERAYTQVRETWSLAGDAGVTEWPDAAEVRNDSYAGEMPVADWHRSRIAVPGGQSLQPARSRWLPAMSLAAALAVGIGLWAFSDIWLPAPNSGTFSTDRGDQRTVSLGDGTRMTLGGASTVRVEFQDQRRDVSMERGEVFFKVARDRARPFTVKSRDLLVTAVGTAFTVRADDLRSVVAVTEGIVDVVPVRETPGGSATSLRARAGEQVIYDASREVSAIQPSDDAIAIGWQDGALTSIDEPLRDVVTRVNRYAKRQVLVAGDIAELRFTGTVLEEQIPEWAAGLERVFPVRVIEQADGSLRLESR